jgi:hypothetical protein
LPAARMAMANLDGFPARASFVLFDLSIASQYTASAA